MTGSEVEILTTVSWFVQVALVVAVIAFVRKTFRAKPQLIAMAVIGLIMALIPCGPIMIFLLVGWSIPTVFVHIRHQRQVGVGESELEGAGSFPVATQRPSSSTRVRSGFDSASENSGVTTDEVSDGQIKRDNPFR